MARQKYSVVRSSQICEERGVREAWDTIAAFSKLKILQLHDIPNLQSEMARISELGFMDI